MNLAHNTVNTNNKNQLHCDVSQAHGSLRYHAIKKAWLLVDLVRNERQAITHAQAATLFAARVSQLKAQGGCNE